MILLAMDDQRWRFDLPDIVQGGSFPQLGKFFPERAVAEKVSTFPQSSDSGFGLQNVVTEYTTDRFIDQLCRELAEDKLDTFNRYPLLKARAKDYVRESQQRLILKPITERLTAQLGQGGLLRKLRGYPDRLRAEQRRGYAGGITDRTICLWDVTTGQLMRTLAGHHDYVTSIRFSPDGQMLASSNADPTILLWDDAGQRRR